MPGIYVPTTTPETQPFWAAAAGGELALQFCGRCERFYFVPRPFCPRCWSREVEWRPVSGRGTLASYVISHIPVRGIYEEIPFVIALVDLAEGPRMLATLTGVAPDPGELPLGAAVEVDFEAREDLHLPVFRPLSEPA